MKYKLIIFDCDGTLVDSEIIANRVIASTISSLGFPMTTEESIEHFAGKSMQHIKDFIEEHLDLPSDYNFETEYRAMTNEIFIKELKCFDGVYELLDKLEIPYCIASNGPKEKMEVTLKATNLDQYFSEKEIFSAYDFDRWKPDPTLFLKVCEQFKIAPSDALVIEDSVSGIDGAINAGIEVFAFCPEGATADIEKRKVKIFKSMKSIENQIFAQN